MQWDPNQPQGPFQPYPQQPQWPQNGDMPGQSAPDPWQTQWQTSQTPPQMPPVQPVYQQTAYTPEQLQQMQYDAYMQPQMPTQQQPMGDMPPQKRVRRPRRPTGGWWKTALVLAVIAGAACFFLKDMFAAPRVNTAVVESASLGETHAGDALVVRNEVAYDEEGVQNVDYVAQEGSEVHRGDVICYVYSTGYSNREMTTLQDYRDQIKNYQQTLLKSETAYDQKMTRLESDVLQRGLEVRSLVQGARGNLMNQEIILDAAIKQRQSYFRSKYSSDMRLNRLYDDESTQQQRIDSWIRQKVATQDSIVSFYTDGFEHALSPAEFEKYTPAQVRSMMNGQRPETSTASRGRTDLYRLVKNKNYAVLMLLRDSDWNPIEGATYNLILEQFSETKVSAKVLSFTRSGGELLLRLAVMEKVEEVLYMRTCSAQLGEFVNCLLVPEKALYTKNGTQGVVLVTQENQVFVPVQVLAKENGEAYVTPVQEGTLSKGQVVRLF